MQQEYRYPIYRITLWYTVEHPTKYHDRYGHTLRPAEPTESLVFDKMYPHHPSRESLAADVARFWLLNLTAQRGSLPSLADQGAKLLGYEIEFRGYEAWCSEWFGHYTLNTHLSDQELLQSFANFVARKRQADWNLQHLSLTSEDKDEPTEMLYLGQPVRLYPTEYYCLMGAEDRWRWKGPCRCEHCQRLGIVRINH